MLCRSCGATNPPEAKFCSQCGTSQASSGEERRVVSVVFADIVGFTALSERRDPEEVKHLVDGCFAELTANITDFGGVVDKIIGDAVVALFGAPIAHEDDPERAVRAALAMQETLGRLFDQVDTPIRMRIGVNTGEVLVGSSTAGGDYTAMGDVMNSAARLEQMAEPGQILVGAVTKGATDRAVLYEPVGRLEARGRDEPIEAWVALEAISLPGAHRVRSASFFGRDKEVALLHAQGTIALDQGGAQAAIVVGDPGMGKTRLAYEAASRMAADLDGDLFIGRCVPYGEANVWWPIATIIRQMLGLGRDLEQSVAEAHLRSILVDRFESIPASSMERLVTAVLHALGYQTPLRGGDRVRNRSEVIGAFTALLERHLVDRPVTLLLSDMHWASDPIWEALDRALDRNARGRLFILLTAREMEEADADIPLLSGRHGVLMLRLGPLDDKAARAFLTELDSSLPATMVDELLARAGGNPFFLEELAGLVHEQGVEGQADDGRADGRSDDGRADGPSGRSSLSADGLRQLPDTLRGIVSARLDALSPTERSLLEDASVLGSSGPLTGLALLDRARRHSLPAGAGVATDGVEVATDNPVDDPAFRSVLSSVVDKDLLEIDGSRFEFRSDLVRDVAYGTLTKTARAQRHSQIADYLEQLPGRLRNSVVVAIADHYRAAASLASELGEMEGVNRATLVAKALYWLEQAGDRALDAAEPADAERWFGYGVDLATDNETLATFLLGRARARCEVHELVGSRADLVRLESLGDQDPVRSAEAVLIRGDLRRKGGDLARAAAALREAADRLAALGLPSRQALALRLLGLTEMARSDDSLTRQALEASRQVASQAGDRRGEAWALQSMSWHAFSQGRVVDANRLAAQAIERFVELGDRDGLSWAQGVQAWVAFHLGQWQTARELLDQVLPESRRRGDPWAEAIMMSLSASLDLWSGRAASALEQARQARALARRADDVSLLVRSMALEGRALVSLGRVAEGGQVLAQAFGEADAVGDVDGRRVAIIANCLSAARLGESERVLRWAARFDRIQDDDDAVGVADLVVAVALARLQQGATDEAASQLAWVAEAKPRADELRIDYFAAAVLTIIAASEGRLDDVTAGVAQVTAADATYHDRTLALLAQAAANHQSSDPDGTTQALASARAQLADTDDVVSVAVVDLVAALCGQGDLIEARDRIRSLGVDPAGLEVMWSQATTGALPNQPL